MWVSEQLLKPEYVLVSYVSHHILFILNGKVEKLHNLHWNCYRDNVFLVNIFCDEAQANWNHTRLSFKSEVTAKPYLELKNLMQDSLAGVRLKDFQEYIVRKVWRTHPILTYLGRPFFHCYFCLSFTVPLMRGLSRSINIGRQDLEHEVIANTSNLSYFTYGILSL